MHWGLLGSVLCLLLVGPQILAQSGLKEFVRQFESSGDTSWLDSAFQFARKSRSAGLTGCDLGSMDAIQTQLDVEEVWVEYYLEEDNFFVFAIKPGHKMVKTIKLTAKLDSLINNFYAALSNESEAKKAIVDTIVIRNFVQNAHELYLHLLDPIMPIPKKRRGITELPIFGEHLPQLIVIADGKLNQIPFDLLLNRLPEDYSNLDWRNLPYLFRSWPIQYHPGTHCEVVLDTLISLWKTDSVAAREMGQVYKEKLAEGKSRTISLNLARESWLKSARNAHPFYWGGFVVKSGKWKQEIETNFWVWGLSFLLLIGVFLLIYRIYK